METNYKCPTWEERLTEVRDARKNLLKGNPFDAIQIIIRRNPYWDADYIDEEWFLEELKDEEQFILDEPKRAKELEEEMRNWKGPVYKLDDDGNLVEIHKERHTIEF